MQVQKFPNELDIFCPCIIKKEALKIMGTDAVSINLESPGKVKMTVKCNDNKKFNLFKKWVEKIKPKEAKVTVYQEC